MLKVLILIASYQFCTGFSASILGFNFESPDKVIKNRIEQLSWISIFLLIMTTNAVHLLNFVRADSTNLPKVDIVRILTYLGDSSNHNVAEIRGAKALIPQFLERIPHINQYKQDFPQGLFNPNLFANNGGVNEFNVFRNTYNPNLNKDSQAHSVGPQQSNFENKNGHRPAPPATIYNNPINNHGPIEDKNQELFDIRNDYEPVTPYQYSTGINENVSNSVDESTFETTTSDYEWSTTDEPLIRIGGAPQAVLTSLLG